MLSWGGGGGGGGGGRQFYANHKHGICIPAASGLHFHAFFANRASTWYARVGTGRY